MSSDTISIVTREQCTGCGACIQICPKKAIHYEDDAEGFPTPVIDEQACVKCGLCEKTCPALHMPETHPIQEAYAVQILDQTVLEDSTSGGVFTALSREIFRRGGVVYGCIWDEHYNAVIRKAENEEEIKPMRGSKYVWSSASDCFPEIKEYLEDGRTVLFTGLPCQIAGLKKYMGNSYDNLFLVDFLCGGTPSPYAFHEYLKTITREVSLEKLNFKLRDKKEKGVGIHISYEGKSGRINQTLIQNSYFFAYHPTKLFLRLPCYHCSYRYRDRIEDITIGDYWGIDKYHTEFDNRAGVSAVLINTEKGKTLWNSIEKQVYFRRTEANSIASANNLTLNDQIKVYQVPKFRAAFFQLLKTKGWTSAERRYLFPFGRIARLMVSKAPSSLQHSIRKVLKGR